MILDIIIEDGEVFDGLDSCSKKIDVGIKNGKIAYLGTDSITNSTSIRVDASGMLVCPGFIDSHASDGFSYLRDSAADHKLRQGITTELFGNCGYSPAPIYQGNRQEFEDFGAKVGFTQNWASFSDYFHIIEDRGLPINVASLVGHNTLRSGIAPDALDVVTDIEIAQMEQAIDQAMTEGAMGLSTGLIYTPGCFANIDEILRLARIVVRKGGFYASHIRNERDELGAAVDEALDIGQEAKIRVLISHLKAAERSNWGKISAVIEKITAYREAAIEPAAFDVYPYTAVSTKLRAFLPQDILSDGISKLSNRLAQPYWRERCVRYLESRKIEFSHMIPIGHIEGTRYPHNIQCLADQEGGDPIKQTLNLIAENPDIWIVYECLSPSDLDNAVLCAYSMICSDSWSYPVNAATHIGDPHPRTYGAFSRFLTTYAMRTGAPLEFGEAVRKLTSIPAQFLGIEKRGQLRIGYWADVVIINPVRFRDKATYSQPRLMADGIEYLIINGELTIFDNEIINRRCGRVLRYGN